MQVETAQPLSEICMEFPDLVVGKKIILIIAGLRYLISHHLIQLRLYPIPLVNEGGYRESRRGHVVITFKGKV